jgi:hypothetical protein
MAAAHMQKRVVLFTATVVLGGRMDLQLRRRKNPSRTWIKRINSVDILADAT